MSSFFSEQFFIPSVCLLLLAGARAGCFAQAPTTTPAMSESARALYQGDPRRAAELAEKRLRQYPNDATEHVVLARAELAQGDFQGAYRELRTALASDPRNIDALYYLAIVAKALSQQEYQRLYALAPDSARVHMLMAEAALAQENPTEEPATPTSRSARGPSSTCAKPRPSPPIQRRAASPLAMRSIRTDKPKPPSRN